MSTTTESSPMIRLGSHIGLIAGLGTTAMSMSAGFIWATQGKVPLVYLAGFFSWTGYLVAHYAVTGVFVDDLSKSSPEAEASNESDVHVLGTENLDRSTNSVRDTLVQMRNVAPEDPFEAVGFIAGIAILVSGIAILAWFVRQESFILGNVGSGMFLSGYVIAHYFDTGKAL